MAKNVRLLGGYLNQGSVAAAGSTATGYAASNSVVLDRKSSWKATNSSAVRLYHQPPAAITPTGMGIALSNFTKYGTCKLQHSTDGSSWTDFYTLASLPTSDYDVDYYVDFVAAGLTPVSKPYWGLNWSGPSAAPEVGLFYLGTLTQLSRNDSYPGRYADVFTTELDKSESLGTVAEDVLDRDLYRVRPNWKTTTPATKDELRNFLRGERGPRRPFFYVPQDESGNSSAGRAYLMRFTPPEFGFSRTGVAAWGEMEWDLLEEA